MKAFMKKFFALVLATAMTSSVFATTAFAADTTDLLADFSFDDEDSGFEGGMAKATGTYSLKDSFDAENGKALYLNGSSQFLTVTAENEDSLLTGVEEITISYDAKPDRTDTSWVFYAAPNANRQGAPEYYIGAFINNQVTKTERYRNGRTLAIEEVTGSGWSHVDIVFAKNVTTVYVNGIKKQSVTNSSAQLTDILGDSSIFQIGKANWGNGEYFKGWIDNFKIYDGALTEADLVSEDAMKRAVAADKEALTLPEEVVADFKLPSVGASGSTLTWEAEDSEYAVIGKDGYSVDVTRADDANQAVVFTAAITMGAITDTKEFVVTVKKNMNDADVVADALESLTIINADNVRGNITLPEELSVEGTDKKVSVSWKSSDTSIVTDREKNGMEAGVVTRQKEDTVVTMTATVTCGEETGSTDIELNIVAKPEEAELTDYLFAFFVNNGGAAEQQIFFAAGHDGNNWMDLNRKEAVLSVADSVRTEEDLEKTQNQAGVRDPYMIRSPEGDKFYLIATDLCIGSNNIAAGTVDWGTAQFNGSRCLRIWESTDLVNWSEPWLADVAPEGTTCAWAPEAIYDTETGQYVVYWASMTGSIQKVYYSLTRDFKTFTEPEMFVDNGSEHIIDTTAVKSLDGEYYRGSATGYTIRMEKCTDTDNWLTDMSSWEEQGNIRAITGFDPALEGPELFMYNEDDWKEVDGEKVPTYGLYADNYGDRGYIPFYTTDIENAEWVQTPNNDYNFDSLHKRHGTIIGLTAEEYDRVMEAYGPNSIEVKSAPRKTQYETTDTSINAAGLVLTVTYADGRTEDISYPTNGKNTRHFTFSGYDLTEEWEQDVTVTYGEQSATFTIKVGAGLPKPVDKSELEALVEECEALDASKYLAEDYDAVMELVEEAKILLDDENAKQKDIDSFAAVLKEAKDSLAEIALPYEDVAETDWFYDAVVYTYCNNIMTGMDKDHFGAYGELSRAQFALILYRMEGEKPVETDKSFGDIAGDEWYGSAVLWAAENGIVTGYQNGNFGPADMITREQMAVMMYRYAKYLKLDTDEKASLASYKDAETVSSFAEEAMGWVVGEGIITGKDSGTRLDPQGNTARSEAAVIIQRFMEK